MEADILPKRSTPTVQVSPSVSAAPKAHEEEKESKRVMPLGVDAATLSVPIARLVAQLIDARTEGLSAAGVAGFVVGWTSALQLVERTDVLMPDADDALRAKIRQICRALDAATEAVLQDPEES